MKIDILANRQCDSCRLVSCEGTLIDGYAVPFRRNESGGGKYALSVCIQITPDSLGLIRDHNGSTGNCGFRSVLHHSGNASETGTRLAKRKRCKSKN